MIPPAITRGCGTRVKGAIYACVGLSAFGSPLEDFLVDPPAVIDPDALGLSAVGVKLIERDGVSHVFDIVGAEHYPNVADFVEEVRRFGCSRRLPSTLDFSKLTKDSRLILVHARAYVANFEDFARRWRYIEQPTEKRPFPRCPKEIEGHEHARLRACCAGVWWQDIVGAKVLADGEKAAVVREMPSFSYAGFPRPSDVLPDYSHAVFMTLPITNLVAVKDSAEKNSENEAKLSASRGIEVSIVDE